MKYDIHLQPPGAPAYWNRGVALAEGVTPDDYVRVMESHGFVVLSIDSVRVDVERPSDPWIPDPGQGPVVIETGAGAYYTIGDLHNALARGEQPVGYTATYLADYGGYLLDGMPLNVFYEGVWYEGQKEVLYELIRQGLDIPTPDEGIAVVPMPATGGAVLPIVAGIGAGALTGNPLIGLGVGVGALLLARNG
jgi:hypothetical protein